MIDGSPEIKQTSEIKVLKKKVPPGRMKCTQVKSRGDIGESQKEKRSENIFERLLMVKLVELDGLNKKRNKIVTP